MEGKIDPITGLPGKGNSLLDWRGSGHDIPAKTPNEMYFSYWLKHDDYDYDSGYYGEGKLMYFVDKEYSVGAIYIANQLSETGELRMRYANGNYSDRWAWCSDSYHGNCVECRAAGTCDNWQGSYIILSNPNVSALQGQWRHFAYYINYNEHYFSIWIDGHKLVDSKDIYPDGNVYYDPELHLHWKGFQLFYASTGDGRDFPGCQDETGHCIGWQIDDLEVWDGLPDHKDLTLLGAPADQSIHLHWDVSSSLPLTSTWRLVYDGLPGDQPSPLTGIVSATRAYTLTGLTNYTWYTVTLNALLDSTPFLTDTVRVMPTDIFVYLPLVRK